MNNDDKHTTPPDESEVRRSPLGNGLGRVYARRPVLLSLAVALVVLGLDYYTGRAVQFPIAYVIPVGLAAWKRKWVPAYGMTVLLPALRLLFHIPWHEASVLAFESINLPITALSLAFYVYLIGRTSRQTQELQRKVRKLEGILPICAACKRIRNEDGVYEPMERYISARSEASFTHGLCPECLPKYS
jgi:hypothetical protein